jgi:dipeptidyl aminopeptidase/acylaminoacyl peptidase
MKNITFLLLFVSSLVLAQKKKPVAVEATKVLNHSVYDQWKEIPYKAISNNGEHAALLINPQDGDGNLVIYNLATLKQDSMPRAAEVTLTFDSQYALFKIKPQKEKVKELRRQKKKKEDLPKDTLGIFSLKNRTLQKIANVKSYKTPEKLGGWVAYQTEPAKETKIPTKEKSDTTKKAIAPAKTKKAKKNSDDNGYTLVIRKLLESKEISFGYVKEYILAKFGQGVLFTTTGNDSTLKSGVYWYNLQKETLQTLHEGKSKFKYKGLSISEDGNNIAFLLDTDTTKAPIHYYKLFHGKTNLDKAVLITDEKTKGVPALWQVSENYTPQFSKDASTLFFGLNPKPIVQDTLKLDEEIVKVEVWTWKDSVLYTQQNKQAETERKRSYLAAYDLKSATITPLADKELANITLADEGNAAIALGINDKPYRWSDFYDISGHSDGYLINVKTGQRKLVAKKIKGSIDISPKANYLFWFSLMDTAWVSYSVTTEKTVALTKTLPVAFADEEDDHPDYPSPYGFAAWTENDAQLLVYDRYDIWSLDPANVKAPINLTKIGREQKVVFRYVKLDPEERFIKANSEILLSSFEESTKASGYYRLSLATGELKKLLMSDHRYANTIKALQSDRILFTRENFTEFPDVWVSNLSLAAPKKITTANPQMKKYAWGSVEIVNWTSLDNIPLKGLLYKPAGFDPSKKYPMIVYFYEKETDNLHRHIAPSPIRASINYTMYTSNGYLVFVPDIVYKIGYPGESAHNCILPGVTSLMSKGFVDEKNIGIQGHSWGGYQTAYLITRTSLFAAAEAGAPVVNMTSAYGGIRWESGFSRMFQYEHSQSRLGGTLWQTPIRYLENSPIFFADKIETPLLMMHNDADGAVPWYQGIEYYMALRRLQKPVWMLNYNGQGHGLTQRQDRTDFAIRMMQFFDYYLKDAPLPTWMKEGVPAIEKGISTGY